MTNSSRTRTTSDGVLGVVYVLHIEPPYKHAAHYVGWCQDADPEHRVAQHLGRTGSPLIRAAIDGGHTVTLQGYWPGTRNDERRIKNSGHGPSVCDRCSPAYRERARNRMRQRRAQPQSGAGLHGNAQSLP